MLIQLALMIQYAVLGIALLNFDGLDLLFRIAHGIGGLFLDV